MDLRRYNLSPAQIDRAGLVLNYQPFLVTDEMQTGAAYSWERALDTREVPPLVFHRDKWENEWAEISRSNESLRRLYEGFIIEIAQRFPGATMFDMACNNGYFPVRAESLGMRGFGSDLGKHYRRSIDFLNSVVGTKARFVHAPFDIYKRRFSTWHNFDVVIVSAIMCHIPNPLDLLAAVARITRKAIFFWGHIAPGDAMTISLTQPNPAWPSRLPFPYTFNEGTAISRPLFDFSMRELGFKEIVTLEEAGGALHLPDHQGLLATR